MSARTIFVEDDEEIWKKIVEADDSVTAPVLSSLAVRLQEDWDIKSNNNNNNPVSSISDYESCWRCLIDNNNNKTRFAYSNASTKAIDGTVSNDDTSSSSTIPEAFKTDEGEKHISAITSLLGLSRKRAVQVTMGALRAVDTTSSSSSSSSHQNQNKENDDEYSNNDNFSSLLGSRELIVKTMTYHHRQRSARLSILTECLRLEQDESYPIRDIVTKELLDPLDSSFSNNTAAAAAAATATATVNARGLFKSLLIVSYRPNPAITRESLEPIKVLRINKTVTTLISSSSSSSSSSSVSSSQQPSINSFVASLVTEIEAQASRERTQAMEGLLALLYQRLQGGISRDDYALLLTAFFFDENGANNNNNKQGDRWKQLAGLICAECMALWKVFEQDSSTSDNTGWTSNHPLLVGIETVEGKSDIEALALLLYDTMESSTSSSSDIECPQSIAFLSYGLLLCLANDDVVAVTGIQLCLTPGLLTSLLFQTNDSSKSLRDYGDRMVQIANDKGGAFDYLIHVMKSLTGEALADAPALVAHDAPYDWQFSSRRRQQKQHQGSPVLMLLDHASDDATGDKTTITNISADIVVYTSIAREIIASSIATFSESILAIDRNDSCQNIAMLCQLVAVVFRNNEPLCQQFWDSWESYLDTTTSSTTQQDQQLGFPICRLMDATYNLTKNYLEEASNGSISKDEFLSAAASFFRLTSALWNTPATAEAMIGMLPKDLIRKTMICCCGPTNSEEMHQNRAIVLESFQALTRIAASSRTCLQAMRMSLEDADHQIMTTATDTELQSFDGPRLLGTILYDQQDRQSARSVLGIIANLLEGAPRGWATIMAGQFTNNDGGVNSATSRLIPYIAGTNEEILSHAAVLVLAELIGHMSSIVFCDSNVGTKNDATIVAFLQSIGAALLSAMTGVATTCIATASVSAETTEIVFQSLSNFLKFIRPVINLHDSSKVREGATLIRDFLINTLATSNGLGEVIVYYATVPASLGVVAKMEETIVDQSIAEQVVKEDDSDTVKKYGPWYSLSSEYKGHSSGANLSRNRVLDFLSNMKPSDFDLEGVQARGWMKGSSRSNGVATLDAAWASIRLLSEWASHVEDIAKTHIEVLPLTEFPLADEANDLIKNLSPQRLLCTVAPTPIPCRADSRLAAMWKSLDISTFDLLLPYLHREEEEKDASLPVSIVLDLLNACITHATLSVPKVYMANSMLLQVAVQSTRFSSILKDLVERGIQLAQEEGGSKKLTGKNDAAFLNAFLSLQIVSSCVAVAPTIADAILGLEQNSGLTNKLIEGALYAPNVLDLEGSQDIFTTEGSIIQMRMAAGCLSVLSALWKNTRLLSKGTSDQVRSSLTKEADRQSSFISDLAQFVTDYANSTSLDERIPISNETEFGRVSTMSFMTSAFEILANAHVYDASKEGVTNAATSNILVGFVHSRRLLGSKNYKMLVASTKQIWKIAKHFGLKQKEPLSFLRSFPATASNLQPHDFYLRENSFNLSSLSHWLAGIGRTAVVENDDLMNDMNDELDKASLLYHLCESELRLMESWKHFLEIAVYKVYSSNDCIITGSSLQRLNSLALDTLRSLKDNLHGAAAAQAGFPADFMSREICQMSTCLSDLLLFLLEIGAFDSLPLEELLGISGALSKAMESRQDISFPQQTEEHPDNEDLECYQQQTLLSCALVICSLIEKREHSRPDHGVQKDMYTSLCLTTCKSLKAFAKICNEGNVCSKEHTAIIRSYASLFTLLVIGYEGDSSSTSSYTIMLSNSFREYEVMKQLMKYATYLSGFVENNMSSSNDPIPSVEDTKILEVIKSVFNLLYAIADTNDPLMITTLHSAELPQLVVRNPLYNLRAPVWSNQSENNQPRGYIFKNESVMIPNQESMMPMYVGSEDPIYDIWLASMQVLGACVRTSSHWQNVPGAGASNLGIEFLDISIEFLRVYRIPLLECLKACAYPSTKMTRLALREAKVLLGMVAELCKRNVRSSFVNSNLELCEEFINGSKYTMTGLSKFLGSTGTSCELFATITEYESTDQDLHEELKTAPLSQIRLSLLSEGLPGAKQKAVRLSHFASGRLRKISQEDYEAAAVIPDHLKALSQESNSISEPWEQTCRLSVTNNFSLELVRASAECVRQALSLIMRTHSVSKSFYVFSEADRAKIDYMSLVEPGIVIGYRPNVGQGIRFDSSDFESLRFGKVLSSNTFNRSWEVKVIRREGFDHEVVDGRHETVTANQLAGIEDKSTRKPSTSLPVPAPDSIEDLENAPIDLTTGNYILTLRWCHQQTTLTLDGTPFYIQQIAEQASILLGTDLVLHELNGAFINKDKKLMSKLDDQIFELFADKSTLEGNVENEPQLSSVTSFPDGRLKSVIDPTVWNGIQSQVRPFIERAWKRRQEIERKRNEKRRMHSGGTEFSWGSRNTSYRR